MLKNIGDVLYLCLLLDCIWASSVLFYEDLANGLSVLDESEGSITCQCGSSKEIINKAVDVTTAKTIFSAVAFSNKSITESVKDFSDMKDYMDNCTWCEVAFSVCTGDPNVTEDYICVRKTVDFNISKKIDKENDISSPNRIVKRKTEFFPKIIDIPIGGYNKSHRSVRHADACSFPTSLETATLHCRVFPSSVKCKQRCAFGYTLDSGIVQHMQCKFKENKWVPAGFKECKPFVDCTLSLISGGFSSCITASLTSGPECNVECLHYEDKEAVPKDTYMCNIDGKWDPPLPFCVVPGSGLVLAKAPKVKLHEY